MSLAYLIEVIIQVLTFAIFFRVILSWFMINPRSGFVVTLYQLTYQLTEPILAPLRRIVPRIGMFDITPIVAIILLQVIGGLLIAAVG